MTDTAAASASSRRPTCSRLVTRRRLARALLVLGVAAATVATSVVPFAGAQPAPAPAPATPPAAPLPADRFPQPNVARPKWEFRIKHGLPKRIVVRHAADPLATPYWYMTYTVTNPGAEPQNLEAEVEMLAADAKVHRADLGIPPDVFEAIKAREGNRLLVPLRDLIGKPVNPGAEQAIDTVAIWPEPARRMETFTVFMAGLSSDTLTMKKVADKWVPIDMAKAAEELENVKEEDRLILRKQFQMVYRVSGDAVNPGKDPIELLSEKWIMRP